MILRDRCSLLGAGLLAALLTSGGRPPLRAQAPPGSHIALVDGWWFTGTGFERRTGFSVDGRFTFTPPVRVDRTIDLGGGYLVPPFGEGHNHNLSTGSEESDRATIRRYLADGVFYVKIQGNIPLTDGMRSRLAIGAPESVDATFAQGALTASGGHPIPLLENVLLPMGSFPGYTKDTLKGAFYFTVNSETDLERQWSAILRLSPDFIKTYLLFSEQFERRRGDPAFDGQKGLDPGLLPTIVAKAHAGHLRVSTHVATAADFHNGLAAGVDEIAHLPSVGVPIAAADAALAAKRHVIVSTTYRNAVPSLIRLQVVGEAEVRTTEAENLKILLHHKVPLAIGSDDVSDTSIKEIEYLHTLGVLDNLTLLTMWSETTPRAIFPNRKIGDLREGFEASFLALQGNPLNDFDNLRRITMRFKQGFVLDNPR